MENRATREKLEKLTAITQRLDWLKSILRVHLRVGTILELEKIARIYLRELINIVACDGAAIIRVDGDRARILAERGFSSTFGSQEKVADTPIIKYLVSARETIQTGDARRSPLAAYLPRAASIKSLLCIPILISDSVRGIIHLDSRKEAAFTEEDVNFTELLAQELSFSLQQSLDYNISQNILIIDQLTECLNSSKFDLDIVVDIASAKEYKEELSLLLVAIDSFSRYGESRDDAKGDALLKQIADILSSRTRPYERLYRYDTGGFIILMPQTGKKQALTTAERLQKTIEQTRFGEAAPGQLEETVTVSIGVATFPVDADHRDKLLAAAEAALGKAKEAGGNRVSGYTKDEAGKE